MVASNGLFERSILHLEAAVVIRFEVLGDTDIIAEVAERTSRVDIVVLRGRPNIDIRAVGYHEEPFVMVIDGQYFGMDEVYVPLPIEGFPVDAVQCFVSLDERTFPSTNTVLRRAIGDVDGLRYPDSESLGDVFDRVFGMTSLTGDLADADALN